MDAQLEVANYDILNNDVVVVCPTNMKVNLSKSNSETETETEKETEKEECVELRNMKYKSMLLKKTNTKQLTKCNSNNDIDSFLEKERTQNKENQWTKLDKSMKISKIAAFVESYSSENNFNEKDKSFLQDFLIYCLEQKKLTKTKDVVYDKINGTITSIPCLLYTPTLSKKFTLKRCEKRPSTLNSLAPKSKASRKTNSTSGSGSGSSSCSSALEPTKSITIKVKQHAPAPAD
jgi:hypothetical protein